MPENPKQTFNQVIGVGQLITMTIGIATLLVLFGGKSQQLDEARGNITELAVIVNDLAKTQTTFAVANSAQIRTLEDIMRRLNNLEQKVN